MSPHQILADLAVTIAGLLERELPQLGKDWWQSCVFDRLSIQQQRLVSDRRVDSLVGLDLAGLLRVLDQNWNSLGYRLNLDHQTRNWIKEAQGIRNRWAHLPLGGLRSEDIYRDIDTLCRLLEALGADQMSLDRAQAERGRVLVELAPSQRSDHFVAPIELGRGGISKGTVVRLKARPDIMGAVLDVVPRDPEARFTVFHGGEVATYYESQVEPIVLKPSRTNVEPEALHAALTATQLRHPSTGHLYSLYASRINFVPYQFRPVLKLIQADRPRLLIADEVGVGKTIEAGLILKELQARCELKSVLVICPKPLVAERKWLEELKRFDEQFTTSTVTPCVTASRRPTLMEPGLNNMRARSFPIPCSTKVFCWESRARAARSGGFSTSIHRRSSISSSWTRRTISGTLTPGPTGRPDTSATTRRRWCCCRRRPFNWATTISLHCFSWFAPTCSLAVEISTTWLSPTPTSTRRSKSRVMRSRGGLPPREKNSRWPWGPNGDPRSCQQMLGSNRYLTPWLSKSFELKIAFRS